MRPNNHHRRRPSEYPHTTLDEDEQSELALKIRYGIGLDHLVGEQAAAETRRGLPVRAAQPPAPAPDPVPPRPDHEIRARAAELGVTAGRRGQWIRR